jgi:hypothetical protein
LSVPSGSPLHDQGRDCILLDQGCAGRNLRNSDIFTFSTAPLVDLDGISGIDPVLKGLYRAAMPFLPLLMYLQTGIFPEFSTLYSKQKILRLFHVPNMRYSSAGTHVELVFFHNAPEWLGREGGVFL